MSSNNTTVGNSPEKPPVNTKRVYRLADLPSETKGAHYRVTDPRQEPREIFVCRRRQQVLEGLMRRPVLSASYCRVSDQVLYLRNEDGIDIETKMYANDPEAGRERYGVYFLRSKVERIGGDT